jgi:large subunit ribosomal protein L25
MEQVTLRAEPRTEAGSRPARRMRREGKVPAVVYGRGLDPFPVAVSGRELYAALRTEAGLNAILNVEVDGEEAVLAVAREIQRHPVRGEITHLDLIKVSLDVAIEAEVGLEFIGTPVGVREGGIVETIENTVAVEALPTAIPSSIPLDISELEVGDTLRISDLPAIEGVTYVDDEDRPIVTVVIPRIVEEEVEEVEEIEGEEGVEVEAEVEAEAAEETAESDES